MSHADISPLMQESSVYIAGTRKRKLLPEVTERAKLHLTDTFASMLSGSRLVPGKRAIARTNARMSCSSCFI